MINLCKPMIKPSFHINDRLHIVACVNVVLLTYFLRWSIHLPFFKDDEDNGIKIGTLFMNHTAMHDPSNNTVALLIYLQSYSLREKNIIIQKRILKIVSILYNNKNQ